jgi:hypothetical protein
VLEPHSRGELFHTCRYPKDPATYWLHVAEHQSKLGVQFEKWLDYHAAKIGGIVGPFPFDDGLEVSATLMHAITVNGGLRERVYRVAVVLHDGTKSREVNSWEFHHMLIDWPNYGVPVIAHFDALFTRYIALLKASHVAEEPSAGGAGAEPVVLGKGLHVVAHCIGGRGRAGTFVFTRMVTGMLLENPHMKPADMHKELETLRLKRKIVENDAQEEFAVAAARRLLPLVA